MKIAIVADFFYPELSGVTDSISLLGKALGERGHEVLFLVPWYSQKDYEMARPGKAMADLGGNVSVRHLPSVRHPMSPTKQGRIALPLGKGVWDLFKFKPDVVYTHSIYGPGIEALVYTKIFGKGLVGTNHTPVSEFLPGVPKIIIRAVLRYTSWYYNRCSFVSAPCQALLNEMRDFGFKKESRPVANPIELGRFSPAASEKEKHACKAQFELTPHSILYTGRLGSEKKIDVIIQAVAIVEKTIPDISLAITGHGSAEESLRAHAENLGISAKVKFLGFIDDAVFPSLYKGSDIFVIMSTAETQSLSLMQAMATGLPTIGARAWGLPEYIEERSGIVLPPGDVDALTKTILDLFKYPAHMKKLGDGGVDAVKKYSPEAIVEQWEVIFMKATANSAQKNEN
jgi:glycosyltransferase involved in cell wall biosynthesis